MAGDWKHGTDNGYTNHRCRCAPCSDARAEYMREWRARTPIPDRVHGSYNGYTNYGCRCEGCRQAYSETKARAYRRRKAMKRE